MLLWTSLVCYNISVTQCVEIQCIWRAHHLFWLICIWCSQKPPCIGMFLHAHFIFQIKNQKRTSFDDLFQYSNKNDKLTRISAEASNLLLYFVILQIDTKIISKVVSFCLCTQQTNKANTVCVYGKFWREVGWYSKRFELTVYQWRSRAFESTIKLEQQKN